MAVRSLLLSASLSCCLGHCTVWRWRDGLVALSWTGGLPPVWAIMNDVTVHVHSKPPLAVPCLVPPGALHSSPWVGKSRPLSLLWLPGVQSQLPRPGPRRSLQSTCAQPAQRPRCPPAWLSRLPLPCPAREPLVLEASHPGLLRASSGSASAFCVPTPRPCGAQDQEPRPFPTPPWWRPQTHREALGPQHCSREGLAFPTVCRGLGGQIQLPDHWGASADPEAGALGAWGGGGAPCARTHQALGPRASQAWPWCCQHLFFLGRHDSRTHCDASYTCVASFLWGT